MSESYALGCPYLVRRYNREGTLLGEDCLATHQRCLVDPSALTRLNCTRRAWLNETTQDKTKIIPIQDGPVASPDGSNLP